MDSQRWKQVEGILQSAMDRSLAERDAFVHGACGGDEALERVKLAAEVALRHPLPRPRPG